MRKKIVAGNWKMNMNFQEGIELAKSVNDSVKAANITNVGVIIATPYIHLAEANKVCDSNFVQVAAENCAAESKGAFTGEISASMIASTGCKYVILGHSERRNYYGETDEILVKKVALALENKLDIIFCIGENLEEREAGKHFSVVESQLINGLFNLLETEFSHIILAYEPVWAIGTGKTASAEQAEEMHKFLRNVVEKKYGKNIAEDTTILYGGSCKPSNAAEIFTKVNVDGGLIGGAALKASDFQAIINARG